MYQAVTKESPFLGFSFRDCFERLEHVQREGACSFSFDSDAILAFLFFRRLRNTILEVT